MRRTFTFAAAAAALFLAAPAAAQQTQCVANAVAGGTVDNITIPLLPCALSTNILILTAAGANTIAQPTLQMAGYPRQNIYTSTGAAPGVGIIPGAGAVILLTSTGSSWKIMSGNASTTFSGVLTVPNGGTGVATLTSNGLLVGQGTGAVSNVAAGTTGQYLVGNTGSPPSWGTISSTLVSSLSFGTTGLTPSGATSGAITVAGTLGYANGGTGLTGTYSNGKLLIGNGTGLTAATLTAGTNMTVTNGAGTITLAAAGASAACTGGSVATQILTDNGASGCVSNPAAIYTGGVLSLGTSTTLAGQVKLFGGTSGSTTFKAASVAGATTITFPGGTTDFSATGGTSQVVKQTASGGAFTVAQLACADLSNSSSGCSGSAALAEGGLKTANFNASSNTTYCIDTVTGAATLTATLPAGPANNDQIEFVTCSNYSVYNFVVSRNGNNIQGSATDLTASNNNVSFALKFYTSYGWRLK